MSEKDMPVLPSARFANLRTPACHKPRDLVAVRDWLVHQWFKGEYREASEAGVFGNTGDNVEYADTEGETIKRASLFWLTDDMCDLLNGVANGMPADVKLNDELIGDETRLTGFLWFEKPMVGHDSHNGNPIKIDAMSWGPVSYPHKEDVVPGIGISWYQLDKVGEQDVLFPLGRSDWLKDSVVEDDTVVKIGIEAGFVLEEWKESFLVSCIEDRKSLASILALISQTNLSYTEVDHLDRPTRRRREREGHAPLPVRVIRLRAAERKTASAEGKRNVEWSHRWSVNAHWRNQAYGPQRSLRKPILIAPYIKGPADRPFIAKDTVRVIG